MDTFNKEAGKSLIVIPTFNERENITKLVKDIMGLPLNFYVVLVDDNSPDGTGAVADELSNKFERVRVIHRNGKGGRGSACIEGFKYALAQDVDYIFEMDADFSHNPNEIPEFLKKMENFDVVIGSRYAEGSQIINWGKSRRIFSKFANFYARSLLKIPISDYTNGYRCYKRHVLNNLDFDEINSAGYIVLSEMAYQITRKGYRIGEVPTVFVNRKRGESNLTTNEIINAFLSIIKLKIKYFSS